MIRYRWSFAIIIPLALFYLLTTNFYALTYCLPSFNFYDAKRILQLILLAYFTLLLGVPLLRHQWSTLIAKLPQDIEGALGIFFLLGIWSAYLALFKEQAFLLICFYFLLIVAIAFIASSVSASHQLISIGFVVCIWLGVLSYLLVFSSVFAQWYPIYKQTGYSIFQHVIFPGFVNERFFAQFQDWTMGLLPVPLIYCAQKRPFYVPFLFLCGACWWALLFYNAPEARCLQAESR